jgi:dTDP-glucose 4,6-dehydratase
MKVLITGAAGFIGSHLVEESVKRGHEVKAFVRYNSANRWGWLEFSEAKENIEVITGDIRDYDSVKDAMKNVEIVFHLAALIGIPYSYVSPLAYIKTNVEGTYNVLQAAREYGTVQDVLITSTSETYGTAQYVPIDEKHPMVGQSPYSATKIAADQLAISFYRSFGLPVKIVRPFNTYGPRQSARAIIPTVITQIMAGKEELRLGNVHPTRDLTFVKDTVKGFWAIANSGAKLRGEITNIGMNEEISIYNLVQKIAKLMNSEIEIVTDSQRVRPEKSEVERLMCNNKKIKENTDWTPDYTLDSGLSETIKWFEKFSELYKSEIYNV